MQISLFQSVLIGLVYYLGEVGTPWLTFLVGYCGLYRPLIGGTIVGFILGDPVTGCIIGSTINLLYISYINAGGAAPANPGLAGTLGTALAIAGNVEPAVAVSIAIPLGLLGNLINVATMSVNVFFVHACDKAAAEGDIDKLAFWNLIPPQLFKVIITVIPVTIAAYYGSNIVLDAIALLPESVMNGLSVVGGVLPALGIAITLRAIKKEGTLLYFIIGFILVQYFGLPIIVIAILAAIIAYFYNSLYVRSNKPEEMEEIFLEDNHVGEKTNLLQRKDVVHSFIRWSFISHSNYNYERLQSTAFVSSLKPVWKRLYGDDEEAMKEALQRHMAFFNTEPHFGGVIHGAVIAMEEEKANGAPITGDAINSIKTGLMGPLAGLGDTLWQGTIVPIFLAIGISMGIQGNLMGPLLYMVLITVTMWSIGYFVWMKGYEYGSKSLQNILNQDMIQSIILIASIIGATVLGSLASSFVVVNTPLVLNISEFRLALQTDVLDTIFKGLLPLVVTFGTYHLLTKKRMKATRVMIILFVVAFILGALGVLG